MHNLDPFTDPLPVLGIEIRLLDLPVNEAFVAGHGSTTRRQLTVVKVLAGDQDTSDSLVQGWGECAALPSAGYWPETANNSFTALVDVGTSLLGLSTAELLEQQVPWPAVLEGLPMARAALEMAMIDLQLKSKHQSLAQWLGSDPTAPAGAAVGIAEPFAVAERVADLVSKGYRRVKIKIEPGHDVEPLNAIIDRVSTTEAALHIHVDANGTYSPGPGDLELLLELARLGVEAIEQPFAAEDLTAARNLISALADEGLDTLVMADEAATSSQAIARVIETGSATGIVVKQARLGGLLMARHVIEQCRRGSLAVSVGGMLESGLGRHAMAAVAALDGVDIIGDLSPARRFVADDPWADISLVDNEGRADVVVPTGPGIAPAPDPVALERLTGERAAFGLRI